MKVFKKLFLFTLLLFFLNLQARSIEITVGDQVINLPSPTGFTEIGSISPETFQTFEDMCPSTNRLLAVFVSEEDAGLIIQGKTGELDNYMLIQISKEIETISLNKTLFQYVRDGIKSQFDLMSEEHKELINDLQNTAGNAISNRINEEVDFNISDIIPLGIDSETASSITMSLLSKYKITVVGEEIEQIVAGTFCSLLIKSKVLNLYVYKTYNDTSDLDWTRKTTNNWMNAVIQANTISVPSAFGEIVPEGTVIDPVIKTILSGQWQKYSIKSHPKSEGLDISIEYPQTWRREEGERPHIVQKFAGDNTNGILPYCVLVVQELPFYQEVFLNNGLNENTLPDIIPEMLPSEAILIDSSMTKIDGEPCAWMKFYQEQEGAGIKLEMYCLNYFMFYKNKMFMMQCVIGGVDENKELIEDTFNSYLPVFQMMAGNIVINDKWSETGNSTYSINSILEDTWGENWLLTLVVSAILTWGIGLTPPLIIRFVIARRPLPKWLSLVFVIFFLFLNIMLFTALGSRSKTHGALFLVAWASYAILYKGKIKSKANGQEIIPNLPSVLPTTLTENNKVFCDSKESEIKRTEEVIEIKETEQDKFSDAKINEDKSKSVSIKEPIGVTEVSDINKEELVSSQEVLILNSESQPVMLGRIEKCANCERIIGKLENSYNFKGNIVCTKCYQILNIENN